VILSHRQVLPGTVSGPAAITDGVRLRMMAAGALFLLGCGLTAAGMLWPGLYDMGILVLIVAAIGIVVRHARHRADRPDPPELRSHVGLGMLLLLLSAWQGWFALFRRRLLVTRWFLIPAAASGLAAITAMEAGWIVTWSADHQDPGRLRVHDRFPFVVEKPGLLLQSCGCTALPEPCAADARSETAAASHTASTVIAWSAGSVREACGSPR
jgi:hypothetical protein